MLYRSTLTEVSSPLTLPDRVTDEPAGIRDLEADTEIWGLTGVGVAQAGPTDASAVAQATAAAETRSAPLPMMARL
jgi:hypothetical protein